MEELKLALSIQQPHIEAIFQGIKTIEYRSRKTNIRERVYLYAPHKCSKKLIEISNHIYPGIDSNNFLYGVIVGSVEIFDCTESTFLPGWEWHLRNPIRYKKPLEPINQPQPVFWRPY